MNLKTTAQHAITAAPAGQWHRRLRTIVLLCTASYAAAGQAGATGPETWPQVWLNPGIYSQHFDSSKGLRNDNIGFGAEVVLANDHVLMAGSFVNSNRARTHFGAYQWRPLHWQFSGFDVGAGIAIGAFDGYPNYRQGGGFVAPLPILASEGKTVGANISLIPPWRFRSSCGYGETQAVAAVLGRPCAGGRCARNGHGSARDGAQDTQRY